MQTFLIKAESKGEGSRGGKIIGHTKGSNRPIYASHGPGHSDYHGFTSSDHSDAAAIHGAAAMRSFKKLHEAKGDAKAQQHYSEGLLHHGAAILHSEHASMHSGNTTTGKAKVSSSAKRGQAKASTSGPVKLKRKKNHDWDAAIKDPRLWNSHNAEDDAIDTENAHRLIAAHPNMTAADHRKRGSDLSYSRGKGSGADNHRGTAHHIAADILSERGNAKKSQAADVLQGYLSKAESKGEGSRGGKISGHTKSGKPIYAVSHVRHELMNSKNFNKQGHYLAMTHRKYSAQDHADASDHYDKLSDAEPHGKERLRLHHIAMAHHYAGKIKQSGEHDAIRNTMKPGSKPATADHWAAANHFNKKFSTDAARHEIDKTLKSQGADVLQGHLSKAESKGEGSRGGKIVGHTKSGKPIYGAGHAVYGKGFNSKLSPYTQDGSDHDERMSNAFHVFSHRAHKNYTEQDHKDIAAHHKAHHQHIQSGAGDYYNRPGADDAHNRYAAHIMAAQVAPKEVKKSMGQAADVLQDGLSKSDTLQVHFHTMWAPKEAYTPSVVVN